MQHSLHPYINAAWHFEYSTLWKGIELSDDEVIEAVADIHDYFRQSDDPQTALKTYLARVLIAAGRYKKFVGLHPVFWPTGSINALTTTKKTTGLKTAIRKEPQFEKMLDIITPHYLQYTQQPSAEIFLKCNEELNTQNLGKWMQTFYEATHHQPPV